MTIRAPTVRSLLAILAAALLLLVHADPARAGDDSGCSSGIGDLPADGAVDVVRNPMIAVTYQSMTWDAAWGDFAWTITLRDGSDIETLAYAVFLVDGRCVPVYLPEVLLAPETTYCIDSEPICFTTGTEADHEAPSFSPGPDDAGSGLLLEWTGSPDIVMITLRVASWLGSQGIAMPALNPIDQSSWAEKDGNTILLTAWDHAGNSTTQAVTLHTPASPASGCQAGMGRSPPVFIFLVLIVLFRPAE